MPHGFMSVDTKLGAGRAFLRSLYEQYAEWGVDFGNLTILMKSFPAYSIRIATTYAIAFVSFRVFWTSQEFMHVDT